jgi:1,4-dihydroxy-2-naphthoate polyprenyltransferase
MTTASQWLAGARPRTLPAAVAPVLVGTGAAVAPTWARALLALVVALALQVGVNYANDYSDGVRGTDADRVGPMRLVGSGAAAPAAVRRAAYAAFAVAAVAGLVLALLVTLWLVVLGAACLAAAWGYTGTSRPYGYRGLGEVSVFVFFGLVAVVGTAYVQGERVTVEAVLGGVCMGALACAILVVNNLRDLPSDAAAGKRTLAVRLGEVRTRSLYALLVGAALAVPPAVALVAGSGWPLLALAGAWPAAPAVRRVGSGAHGPELVPVLGATGRAQLVVGALLALGLVLA